MFSDPVKNLKALALKENNIVADLGAGTGFYSVAAAHMVPQGKVYAVEVQQDFITKIKHKISEARLHNIEVIWGDVEKIGGTKIKDRVVDAVIMSNILFQVEHKDKLIEETKRILKPGGQVLFIDWSDASSSIGPSFDTLIPKAKAREIFEKHGFSSSGDVDAGHHHYGMIFKR